jgi:1,4-dihydroxy-2-naphthoyl-CoA hydrolase
LGDEVVTFDRHIGMRGYDDGGRDGRVTAEILIEQHHCNPTGAINGGVILSLADNIATGCANRAYFEKTGERRFMVGIDVHAVMLSNQRLGDHEGGCIRGEARVVRVGRRVTVVRTVVTGEGEKALAEVTTTHVPD